MDRRGVKLLYFTRAYTPHDRRFLAAFVQYGFDVSYLRLTGESLDESPIPDVVSIVPWIGDRLPYDNPTDHEQRREAVESVLSQVEPDVVLAGPIQSCVRLVAVTGFSPFVAMSWGSDILVDAAPGTQGEEDARDILSGASAAFGDCEQVRDAFRKLTDLSRERIVIFPWGIDTSAFHPQAGIAPYRHREGWAEAPVIISLRSWEPIYAVDVLVDAFAKVRAALPAARLVLAGDGSLREDIRTRIAKLNLEEAVLLPGRIPNEELPAWLASANLYVSAALSDGTSISLLEAMACGLPAVVTEGYGNLEWVEPDVNGLLVPPRDSNALAGAIAGTLHSTARDAMARANREKAVQRANWYTNIPKLCDVLETVGQTHG